MIAAGQIEASINHMYRMMQLETVPLYFLDISVSRAISPTVPHADVYSPKSQDCISCDMITSRYHGIILLLHILRGILVPGWRKPHACENLRLHRTTDRSNFWQWPGRQTTSMQVPTMISSLEKVYQWCGKAWMANNASITMKYGEKVVHFQQKHHLAPMQNASKRGDESSSLFLPVIITSISNGNYSPTGRTLLLLLWICHKCDDLSRKERCLERMGVVADFPPFSKKRVNHEASE